MKITRDGKTYELTIHEMAQAAQELCAIERDWEEADDKRTHARKSQAEIEREKAEWKAFLAGNCKDLPFPKNLIVERIYEMDIPKCKAFLDNSPDLQNAYAAKVLDALGKAKNEKAKECIVLRYRDRMSIREIAEQLGYSSSHINSLIYRGTRTLRDTLRYEERKTIYDEGTKAFRAASFSEIEIAKASGLNTRMKMYLAGAGVTTLAQLFAMTREEVLAIPGVGFQFCSPLEMWHPLNALETCAILYNANAAYLTDDNAEEEKEVYEADLIYRLHCSARTALYNADIQTDEELLACSKEDLLKVKGIGPSMLRNIAKVLSEHGHDVSHLIDA